jgi:hypothetical protein
VGDRVEHGAILKIYTAGIKLSSVTSIAFASNLHAIRRPQLSLRGEMQMGQGHFHNPASFSFNLEGYIQQSHSRH